MQGKHLFPFTPFPLPCLHAAVSTCTRKCFLCLLTRVEWVAVSEAEAKEEEEDDMGILVGRLAGGQRGKGTAVIQSSAKIGFTRLHELG